MLIAFIVLVVVVGGLAALYAFLYNSIISSRNRVQNAWENIEANLQRRNDLIPNLVSTVKGYATHETDVFEQVTRARAASLGARTPEAVAASEEQMASSMRQLFAVAEAYPDLKADANFRELQTELANTENRIVYARQSYNDCVYTYNNAIESFPGNIIAQSMGAQPKEGFRVESAEVREVPKIEF